MSSPLTPSNPGMPTAESTLGPRSSTGSADLSCPPTLSIVLGTLNECTGLAELVGRIRRLVLPPYELVIVDDGSTDGTREYAQALASEDPRVRILLNERPRTLIPAQSEGIEAARGAFVVIMDSDLQHPPEKIPEFYEHLRRGAQIVIASRYLAEGSTGDRSPIRSVISRGAELIARIVIGDAHSVTDPMSGFYAFQRTLFRPPVPMHRGYHLLPYLLMVSPGAKVQEVPYSFGCRASGSSKVTQNLGFIRIFLRQMLVTYRIRSKLQRTPAPAPEPLGFPVYPSALASASVEVRPAARMKTEANLAGVFGGSGPVHPRPPEARREDSVIGHDSS